MQIEQIEADVLCVGGGIAGLMAAIRAGELGAKVVVAEKANTMRSGAGGVGNDHFCCYIPEVHGNDLEAYLNEASKTQMKPRVEDRPRARIWFAKTFDIIQMWGNWGIPVKYEGKYEFAGHCYPGSPLGVYLKYYGRLQKAVLTREAKNRGAKIVNRVMVCDLLGDKNGVTGAIGVDTREEKMYVFSAKTIVLGTGMVKRLYPNATPALLNNMSRGLTLSGDGRAMAYRLGAELFNMESLRRHAGPKYFVREGQATWVGVFRDPQGNPVGPFLTKPDRRYSDMIIEVNKDIFSDYAKQGKGPIFMDCRGISDEDLEYMKTWLREEGNVEMLNHLAEEGIDLQKHPVEFQTFENMCPGGIRTNSKAEASIKGLYAAGDENIAGISAAATFGWIAGDSAAAYAAKAKAPRAPAKSKIEAKEKSLQEIRDRRNGPDWREANYALQQLMNDYAGQLRSKSSLEAGLGYIRRLKTKAQETIGAGNQHELARALETLNLIDLGETVFVSALERRETRGLHVRADFPYTNPLMDKLLVVKKTADGLVAEWREKGY